MDPAVSSQRQPAADFGRTRWSIVRALRQGAEAEARSSLAELCRRYWVPVYAYVRHCGHPPQAAAGLTQSFLSHLLQRLRADGSDAENGFRQFLKRQLQAFLASNWTELETAAPLPELAPPWPLEEIEQRQRQAHAPDASPERAFQRSFAFELLSMAMEELRTEAAQAGRTGMFAAVLPWLTREPPPGEIAALSERLDYAPLATVIAIRRLRQRFQELVDGQLLQTLDDATSLEVERLALLRLMAESGDGG